MSSTTVPSGVGSDEYWICPTASREASLLVSFWTAASASVPAISISPMWLTSNSPTRSRTARCSAVMPAYSTGMSQPPKGTMRAPSATCAAWRAVFRSGGAEADGETASAMVGTPAAGGATC